MASGRSLTLTSKFFFRIALSRQMLILKPKKWVCPAGPCTKNRSADPFFSELHFDEDLELPIKSSSRSNLLVPRLLKNSPREIAEQLTAVDSLLFKAIPVRELSSMKWTKKDKSQTPNIKTAIDRWNKVQ